MVEKNLNIKKIQESTSLSRTTISNLINHYSNGIQFDTLVILCKLLNCKPGDLLVMHDIELKFEEIDSSIMELSNEEKTIEDLLDLTLNCLLMIDGKNHNFHFKIECTFFHEFEISSYKIIDLIPSIKFKHFLKNTNFPSYIEDYIHKELKDFVREWIEIYINSTE